MAVDVEVELELVELEEDEVEFVEQLGSQTEQAEYLDDKSEQSVSILLLWRYRHEEVWYFDPVLVIKTV